MSLCQTLSATLSFAKPLEVNSCFSGQNWYVSNYIIYATAVCFISLFDLYTADIHCWWFSITIPVSWLVVDEDTDPHCPVTEFEKFQFTISAMPGSIPAQGLSSFFCCCMLFSLVTNSFTQMFPTCFRFCVPLAGKVPQASSLLLVLI